MEELNEKITVSAEFLNTGLYPCRPLRFTRANGRVVEITEIGLVHPRHDGIKTLWAFDVTDGTSDYRLLFNSENLTWQLTFMGDEYAAA
jgi:hypothetical protein